MLLVLRTIIIGALGGFVAYWLGLPSAWLIGALLAVVLAGVSHIQVAMPDATSQVITLFLGISVALNIEAGLADQLLHWAGSITLMSLMLVSLLWVLYRFYAAQHGWQRDEALLCSVPGNLAIILSMAVEIHANVRRISLIHNKMTKSQKEDRGRELLALVGLEGFEDKRPSELSGGMRQRASLCRAIVHKPDVLIMDEPFGALDAFTREDLWQIMHRLRAEEPFTGVLITHDLRESIFLADQVVVLSQRPARTQYVYFHQM